MASPSPMVLTLKYLRDRGLPHEIVERRIGPKTIDWAGCIDLQTVFRDFDPVTYREPTAPHVVAIQLTTGDHFAHRQAKVDANLGRLRPFMEAGIVVECWGWSYLVGRGKVKKPGWVLRRRRLEVLWEVNMKAWCDPAPIYKNPKK